MALQMTNVTAVVPKRPKRSSFLGAAAALGGAYSALPADVKKRIFNWFAGEDKGDAGDAVNAVNAVDAGDTTGDGQEVGPDVWEGQNESMLNAAENADGVLDRTSGWDETPLEIIAEIPVENIDELLA